MISVLRLGHRIHRDIRVTTHLALTSRAFLAEKLFYTGQKDTKFENSISVINKKWGSKFDIEYVPDYKRFLKNTKFLIIHLTMYGIPLQEKLKEIKNSKKDILVIVGGQKVPGDIFGYSDVNISITSQPISEISALAIFLNEILKGKPLINYFDDARIKVIPNESGKKIEKA